MVGMENVMFMFTMTNYIPSSTFNDFNMMHYQPKHYPRDHSSQSPCSLFVFFTIKNPSYELLIDPAHVQYDHSTIYMDACPTCGRRSRMFGWNGEHDTSGVIAPACYYHSGS
jgi:hypothetical protein